MGALLFSAYTYSKHDKKIKAQEQIINDYQINKIAKENEESKKASIRGNIIKGDKGKRTLKVYNCGKATARNIRVEGLKCDGVIIMQDNLFPYELMTSMDYTELTMCPAVLTENFFMDGLDFEFLQSKVCKQAIVDTHVEGIIEYLEFFIERQQ